MKLLKDRKTIGGFLLVAAMLLISAVAYANGETASFGVDGFTSGGDWNISSAKTLVVEANNLSTEEGGYSIRITIAKGMILDSYLWNTADTTNWTKSSSVKGSPVPMDTTSSEHFTGGSLTLDASGNTVLTYNLSDGASRINLTDKIVVVPDDIYTFRGDEIPEAIRFNLLNRQDQTLATSSVRVNITGDSFRNYSYTSKKFLPGDTDVHLYDVDYGRTKSGATSRVPFPVGTVDITLGIPAPVSEITRVVPSGKDPIPASQYSFDAEERTLTITGYEVGEGEGISLGIYGSIKSDARPGNYAGPTSKTNFEYTDTYSDETVTYSYDDGVSLGNYYIMITERQDTIMIAPYGNNTSFAQFPEGYPGIFGKMNNFYTANAQEDDQLATWTFPEGTLDVIGVFFPVDIAESVAITSVTFDDGTTITPDNLTVQKGSNGNPVYINVADIRAAENIPDTARYIRSITANCGTFSNNYTTRTWRGLPVGYFSQAVVNAGVAADVNFTFKVNSAETQTLSVKYDPDNEFAALDTNHYVFSGPDRRTQDNAFKAGDTVYMRSRISAGVNALTPTHEPRFFIVVPSGMTFNPDTVMARRQTVGKTTTEEALEGLRYSSGYVQDAQGNYQQVYEFYVPDFTVSYFQDETRHGWDGEYTNSLILDYEFEIDETADTQTMDIGDYAMSGKGDLVSERFTKIYGTNSSSNHLDNWDLNGNGNRSEQGVVSGIKKSITILDNMNITVSGYLTHEGSGGAVNPYNPGSDGSNEVNVVEFMPDTNADYHVIISNTLLSVGDKCAVNAYIPIPNGTFSGDTFDPINTDPNADPNKIYYQFRDYEWPMALRSGIENVDSNSFDIIYYLGLVSLGANGKPESDNTLINPGSLTDEQLKNTVLVEIRSKEGVRIPSGSFEFVLPLTVGVSETQATQADLNLTKNIFRPRYYREGGIGDLWVNGNYVAARLAVSSIGGYIFDDNNGNGHWEESEEEPIPGLKIELYDSEGTKLGEQTASSEGKYSFTADSLGTPQLGAGTYTLKFINADSTRVFTQNHPATRNNYRINSEAVPDNDHGMATAEITLPYDGVLAGYQEYQNAGLFVDAVGGGSDGNEPDGIPDACEVRVNYDADHGSISGKDFEYFYKEDGNGGYLRKLEINIANPPTAVPDTGTVFLHWKNDYNDEQNSDGKFIFSNVQGGREITLTAVHEERSYTVSYDLNADGVDLISNPADFPDQTKLHDVDLTLSTRLPEADGHAFIGWNTASDGSGVSYQRSGTYTANEALTLYAQWEENVGYFDVSHITENLVSGTTTYKEEHLAGKFGEELPVPKLDIPGFSFIKNYQGTIDRLIEHDIEYDDGDEDNPIIVYPKEVGPKPILYYYSRNKYTITFETGGGTEIDPIEEYFEEEIDAPDDPVREGFNFLGWDKEIPETMPSENMTITARWEEIPVEYTLTFLDYDGSELGKATGVEGSDYDVPQVPGRTGYNFTGWDPGELPDGIPDHDMTITAQYSPIEYTITYNLNGGTETTNPRKYTIESGAISLQQPTKSGFTFAGWTGTDVNGGPQISVTIPAGSTGNRSYTAHWPSEAEYLVKHYKQKTDGTYPDEADEEESKSGSIGVATAAEAKTYEGFTAQAFEQTTITDTSGGANPAVVEIRYARNTYTVTWKNDDGQTLETDADVMYGVTPTYDGETPTKTSDAQHTYEFDGWTPDITAVTEDATYTATFTETTNSYTVKWVDDDGETIIDSKTVEYGQPVPEFDGTIPTKEATDEFTYEFKEWVPDAPVGDTVTGEITFTASYTETKNKYTITFVDEEGNVLQEGLVEYGSLPEYTGATPTKDPTDEYTYVFNGWTPDITAVTEDATYTATFLAEKNPTPDPDPEVSYTFTKGVNSTWKQDDGNGASFTVSRSVDDDEAFDHFTGIEVDGAAVSSSNYDAEPGSVKLALKSDYIDSLEVGEHKLKAIFDDGSAETTFYVVRTSDNDQDEDRQDDVNEEDGDGNDNSGGGDSVNKSDEGGTSSGRGASTGDDENALGWLAILMLAGISAAAVALRRQSR